MSAEALRLRTNLARGPQDALQQFAETISHSMSEPGTQMVIDMTDVVFWARETAGAVAAASRSYPLEGLKPFVPSLPRAFCVFQDEILFGVAHIQWAWFEDTQELRFWYDGSFNASTYWPDVSIRDRNDPLRTTEVTTRTLDMHGSLEAPTTGPPTSRDEAVMRWVFTAIVFMDDEVGASDVHVGKYIRDRVGKSYDRPVKVVYLRTQRHETEQGNDDPESANYRYRFWVSGHWRMQPYKDGIRPKWIAPYTKANDKPFGPARETVYAVTR